MYSGINAGFSKNICFQTHSEIQSVIAQLQAPHSLEDRSLAKVTTLVASDSRINDQQIDQLSALFPNLNSVNLSRCECISASSVSALLKSRIEAGSEKLAKLDISGCPNIMPAEVGSLDVQEFPLREFLVGCPENPLNLCEKSKIREV